MAIEPQGRVVVVGIPSADRTAFQASIARRKEITMQLSRRSRPADLRRAIAMAGRGEVDLGSLVTSRYTVSTADDAFEELVARRGLKVLVQADA
jgi:L-iditol 2-dehydrogenase